MQPSNLVILSTGYSSPLSTFILILDFLISLFFSCCIIQDNDRKWAETQNSIGLENLKTSHFQLPYILFPNEWSIRKPFKCSSSKKHLVPSTCRRKSILSDDHQSKMTNHFWIIWMVKEPIFTELNFIIFNFLINIS